MGSIKHMPEELHSSVRSGVVLYDLARVVEELVFNSLDAGATKVHVALDVSTCYVKVKDNGSGISRDGLVLVGQRYATSKHGHLGDTSSANGSFGFRGEALCSISDVALLEIITRTHGMPNGYRKVMKGCKCLYLGISDETYDVGTTVIVRDLFYNQPVRRKHIQSSPKKVLHSVKSGILRIALVHSRVLFRVIDVESENDVLSAGPSSSPLPLLTSGFGIDTSSSFRELNRSDGILKLSGYVSGPCDIMSSKVFQYIYINSRFVCKGPIHKLINQLALRFSCIDDGKPESRSHSVKQSYPQLSPSFFLNLICERPLYDITFEPSRTTVEFKDWGAVLTFIENVVSEFWSESEPHALPLKNDFGKKRRRIQEDKGSLLLPTSPPRKLHLDHNSLSSWRDCRDSFEKYVGDASDFDDHGCLNQVECLRKSYDRTQIYLGGRIDVENDFGKKRRRIQEDEGFLQLPTSPPRKLNLDHTSLPSWGDCRDSLEKYVGDASGFDDHIAEEGCSNKVECLRKSYDRPHIYLGGVTGAENDFGKKRLRIQGDEGSLEVPTSPPQKLNLDHTSLPSWGESRDSFGKYVGDASGFDDHIAEDSCFNQVDCSQKSYDRHQIYLGGLIGVETSNVLESSHCSFISNGDNFLENELIAPERPPFSLVKCSSSTWEEPTTIDARRGDISEESFNCRAFSDGIGDVMENEQPFLNDGLSGQRLLGYESSSESDDAFNLRTDCFRTKHKWDVHDDGFGTGGLENLGKVISARSSVHGNLPSTRSFLSSGIQHSKKIYDDSFSKSQQNPFLSPSMDEDEKFCPLPSDLVKPTGDDFDSHLSPIESDPFWGVRHQVNLCSDEDGSGTLFKSDQILSDRYSDITGRGYSGFSILGEIAQENYGSSRFSAWKGDVYNRNDFGEPGDNYMKSDNGTDMISSHATGNEAHTNFHVEENYSSSFDCERNVYGSHIWRQGKQSDSRKMTTRCHSAPPIYRGRKRFLAVSDLDMLSEAKPNSPIFHDKAFLPDFRVKQAQHYSKSIRWKCSPQSPTQSHLVSARNPATVIPDVNTSSGIQDYESHGKDNDINACDYDPQEECKLKSREHLFDYEADRQDMLPNSAGRNMSFKNENEASILDISSGILHLSGDSLVPNSIDKSFLERARVLQQVDKKYIPVVGCKALAIIDQHAADERIRLEELRKQVLSGEMKTVTYLETEQDLVLPEIGFQLLHDYAEKIRSWGWICNIHSQDSESLTKNMKILHSHPNVTRLLAVPCILGVNLTDGHMLEYLQQLADTDGSSTIPPAVNRILNNKACRGAIMFGDALLPSECSLIVEELERTSLCFQCAHGRPTTVPIVNMDMLHKQIANLRLASGNTDGSWHGLRRHKISLERASHRIS